MHGERVATKHRIFRRFNRVIQVTLIVLKGGRSQIRDDGAQGDPIGMMNQ
jgi:hypothetical protein